MNGLPECYKKKSDSFGWTTATKNHWECKGFRLADIKEWEFAARAGEPFRYSGSNNYNDVAVYNIGAEPSPSCTKSPNKWELCDMSGNLSEWVWDRDFETAEKLIVRLSTTLNGESNNKNSYGHIAKGGSFRDDDPRFLRIDNNPVYTIESGHFGLRVVRTIPNLRSDKQ